MTSADRKVTYTKKTGLCDDDLTNGKWYRFEGGAGTRMPTECVQGERCGTAMPGWLNGAHPTVADGEESRTVCFQFNSQCCYESYKISVKNCTSYYIYKLYSTQGCPHRYCGTD